jgi:hypothetical protein
MKRGDLAKPGGAINSTGVEIKFEFVVCEEVAAQRDATYVDMEEEGGSLSTG